MTDSFSAWKIGAFQFVPAILGGLVCLYLVYRGHRWAWVPGVILLGFGCMALGFFRDPQRVITAKANELVSPADGKVVAIEELKESPYYDGPCKRISIFLSVLNVHVNRTPFDAVVKGVAHKSGQFLNAMRPETTDCNESNAVRMDTANGPITVRQIAGLIARRIICRAKVGDTLKKGQRFGMIMYGSRTELYLPMSAEVLVKVSDKVQGASSIVAKFPE